MCNLRMHTVELIFNDWHPVVGSDLSSDQDDNVRGDSQKSSMFRIAQYIDQIGSESDLWNRVGGVLKVSVPKKTAGDCRRGGRYPMIELENGFTVLNTLY